MPARFTTEQQSIIDQYLVSGHVHGRHWTFWPSDHAIESMKAAGDAMSDALIAKVKSKGKKVRLPDLPTPEELAVLTRTRVEPMVRGLFPAREQAIVLGMLEKSVVFVTPGNIERLLHEQSFRGDAWTVANLYLTSIGADLLGPKAPSIVGFSQETTCFVSPEYLAGRGKFDDFVVHETAHIFHNWKREYAGLPFTRTKEWLLQIDFCKRETFAYSCEVYARIVEQGGTARERAALVEEYSQDPSGEDRVDLDEHLDILREAVEARNGWKRILARCAPASRRARAGKHERSD